MFFPFSTSTISKLKLLVILVTVGIIGAQCTANRILQRQHSSLAMHADSLEVSLDVTRAVLVGVDVNRNFWQRRAYQESMKADGLDKKLHQESKVREQLSLTIDSLNTRLYGAISVDSSGARIAQFHTYKAPFTVDIGVRLPAPPDTGVADVKVAVDTAYVGVRVGCGKAKDGVKPASVTVSSPKWLNVNIDSATQDVGVCNRPKPTKWQTIVARTKDVLKIAAGVGLGFLLK